MAILFAFREDRFGFRFKIGDHALLGRSPECDLILFDRAASRRHAEIIKTEEGFILKDLGSTNGVLFNGNPLFGQTPLKKNDEIVVGQEIFLFDPDLDVAVGPEGTVLIVGEVETEPEGMMTVSSQTDLTTLDRSCLAPLYQVASALANRPKRNRVLKQVSYALSKIFRASSLILLWPESMETERLSSLLARPNDRRLALPRPLVDLVLSEKQTVLWPRVISSIDYIQGERLIEFADFSAMAMPLQAYDDKWGLLYVESDNHAYTVKELNFFSALGNLIASSLANAVLINQLDQRIAQDEEKLSSGSDFIGDDDQIKALLGTAYQIGMTDSRMLLTGEVGTGKEVLARRIHAQSPRRRAPFISINCSAYSAGQIERALFGEEAGAISEEGIPGALELADGGTIFIKHINDLSLSGQVELLRTLEEGLTYRVGSNAPRPVNVRTIASTSVDLDHLVNQGEFREDLYRRLSMVVLELPPLRAIKGDIALLANHFLSRFAREKGLPVPELDPAALESLAAYPWPGNVGELKNVMERLIMFAGRDRICVEDLTPDIRFAMEAFRSFDGGPQAGALGETERILIRRAFSRSNGAISLAADILGLTETALEELMRLYDISVK